MGEQYITLHELQDLGFTKEDVAAKCPHAVVRTALDGQDCWEIEELAPLLGPGDGE